MLCYAIMSKSTSHVNLTSQYAILLLLSLNVNSSTIQSTARTSEFNVNSILTTFCGALRKRSTAKYNVKGPLLEWVIRSITKTYDDW